MEQAPLLKINIEHAGYDQGEETIRNIDFTLYSGQLIGLIGPNGAGKSTTIKSILGLLKYVEGSIEFIGKKQNYAYIPEQPIFYEQLTLWEHLQLAAVAHEQDLQTFTDKGEYLLEKFRMQSVKHHLPTSFSKGMQQKLMLIIGFLIQPDIYIVDEPFVGLDPRATMDFLSILDEERERGAGVLMSTHVLDTAEKICDSFILIEQGSVVAAGTLEQVRQQCNLPTGSLFECFYQLT